MKKKILFVLTAILLCLSMIACQGKTLMIKNTDVLLTIDGAEVTVADYRYQYEYQKNQMGDADFWKENAAKEPSVKEAVLADLRSEYAIRAILDEAGIVSNDDDKAYVEQRYAELQKAYGSETESVLLKNGYSVENYRVALENESRQYRYLYETQKDAIQKEYVRVKHILVSFDKLADDEEANRKDCKELADELAERAQNGENFEALIGEYGSDPGMAADMENGYYFTTGKMVPAFEEASFALKEGEISDPVETEYGYHIIKRYPMEEAYLKANVGELLESKHYKDFSDAINAKVEAQKIEYTDIYKTVGLNTFS